jgi:hypothetical protein
LPAVLDFSYLHVHNGRCTDTEIVLGRFVMRLTNVRSSVRPKLNYVGKLTDQTKAQLYSTVTVSKAN